MVGDTYDLNQQGQIKYPKPISAIGQQPAPLNPPSPVDALQNALKQRGMQDTQLTRMLQTYGADGLIRLMNIIAKNNQNTEIPDNYA